MDPHQIHAALNEAMRLAAWLFLVSVIFLPLEWLFAVRARTGPRRAILGDLCFYVLSGVLPNLIMAVPLSLAAYAAYRFVPWRVHHAVAEWPLWARGLAAFVVADLGFYWGHRITHHVPFLWRFHAIHHAPEHVYFLISSRAHPIDNSFTRLCGLIPIYLLGLGAPRSVQGTLVATLLMLFVTLWGFFIHANVRWRLGPLEWLVSTPAFHHWHHTSGEVRDRNFASMLPCWDWLFGTLHLPRKAWPPAYGVDEALPSSVVGQLAYPLLPPRTPERTSAEAA